MPQKGRLHDDIRQILTVSCVTTAIKLGVILVYGFYLPTLCSRCVINKDISKNLLTNLLMKRPEPTATTNG